MKKLVFFFFLVFSGGACKNSNNDTVYLKKTFQNYNFLFQNEQKILYKNSLNKCYLLDSLQRNIFIYRNLLIKKIQKKSNLSIVESFLIEKIWIPKNSATIGNVIGDFEYCAFLYFKDTLNAKLYRFVVKNYSSGSRIKQLSSIKVKKNINEFFSTNYNLNRNYIYQNYLCDNFNKNPETEFYYIVTKTSKKQSFCRIFIDLSWNLFFVNGNLNDPVFNLIQTTSSIEEPFEFKPYY